MPRVWAWDCLGQIKQSTVFATISVKQRRMDVVTKIYILFVCPSFNPFCSIFLQNNLIASGGLWEWMVPHCPRAWWRWRSVMSRIMPLFPTSWNSPSRFGTALQDYVHTMLSSSTLRYLTIALLNLGKATWKAFESRNESNKENWGQEHEQLLCTFTSDLYKRGQRSAG